MEHVSGERPFVADDRPFVGYALPLSRLQVSWGAILAGAVTTLAVSIILWTLGLAIVLTATSATLESLRASMVALGIIGIVTTLIGGYVGGMVAGYLPGNPRRVIASAHGFLSWGVAFLVAVSFQLALVQFMARTTTNAVVQTTSAAVQGAGAVAGGAAPLSQRAQTVLQSLGFSPAESSAMVNKAQTNVQQQVRRGNAAEVAAAQAKETTGSILGGTAAAVWLWFGTWFIAGLLSMLGAANTLGRVRRVPTREREFFGHDTDVEYVPLRGQHVPIRP